MKNLLKYIFLLNLLAGGAVWIGYRFYALPFEVNQDVLFSMFALQWGLAALVWQGGSESSKYDDAAGMKTSSMLSSEQPEQSVSDKNEEFAANYGFGFMLFLSGLFPLSACILLSPH
ncbi:hypothetical protein KCN56_09980 [Photobacterium galatheae]|uniref:hypothetical protein n=1 Tax=Photobacterium galatheae TaxID=1654360 RepID=UPI00202CFDB0|nr:hypothetical protein [Photobacterium galatheae]MCM0148891.1 hypothetical protein [Photobacterium galatheae]